MRYTIKDILFEYVRENEGLVSYEELTQQIHSKFPKSEWKETHWAWYKCQISSPNGKYFDLFTEKIRNNLKSINKSYRYQRVDELREKTSVFSDSYEFKDNTNVVEKEIAVALAKVCYHIHPRIVEKIVNDNIKFKNDFLEFFNNDHDTKCFLE